jgi:hypothetical protein
MNDTLSFIIGAIIMISVYYFFLFLWKKKNSFSRYVPLAPALMFLLISIKTQAREGNTLRALGFLLIALLFAWINYYNKIYLFAKYRMPVTVIISLLIGSYVDASIVLRSEDDIIFSILIIATFLSSIFYKPKTNKPEEAVKQS